MTVNITYHESTPGSIYEHISEEMEIIGVVYHKLADDGKSGHIIYIASPTMLPEGAQIYIKKADR